MTGMDEQQLRLAIVGAITILVLFFGVAADIVLLSKAGRWQRRFTVNMRSMLAVNLPFIEIAKYGLILAGSFFCGLMLIFFYSRFFSHGDEELTGIIIQSITLHGMVIVLTAVYLKQQSVPLKRFFGIARGNLVKDVLGGGLFLLVSMPVILFFSILYRSVLYVLDVPLDLQDIMLQFAKEDYSVITRIYLLLLAVVVAPVAEEILFRGVVFRWVAQRSGMVAGMIISSILFALIHMHIPSFGPIFMLAIALSFFYALSGSLLVPIVMHSLFNLFGLAVYYIAGT